MPPDPEKDKKQPQKAMLSDAVDLSERFGGLDRVPEEELSKVGFKRVGDNIAPLEGFVIGEPEKKKVKEPQSLEEKTRNAPFGEIKVNLSGKELPFRRLSNEQIGKLGKQFRFFYEQFEEEEGSFDDYIPHDYPILVLRREFAKYTSIFKGDRELHDLETDHLRSDIFHWWALDLDAESSDFFQSSNEFIQDYIEESDGELIIPGHQAERMYRDLERLKGKLADHTILEKFFQDIQNRDYTNEGYEESLGSYCQSRGLKTNFEVVKHFFGGLLEHHELTKLAQELQKATSTGEAATILTTHRDESLMPIVRKKKG